MIPPLVPEISPLDAFCDVVVAGVAGVVVVRIGDSICFKKIHLKFWQINFRCCKTYQKIRTNIFKDNKHSFQKQKMITLFPRTSKRWEKVLYVSALQWFEPPIKTQ